MASLKTLLLGTTLAASAAFLMGMTAHVDETYTVQSGDTLSTISQRYVGGNSLINVIAESNPISDISLVYPGQQLTIPTEGFAQVAVKPQTVVQGAPTQAEQPVVQGTVQAEKQVALVAEIQPAPAVAETTVTPASTSSAKGWIAQKEPGGFYTAMDGRYIGCCQLDSSYLNGDYSTVNQERAAEQYVTSRYGSWEAAKTFQGANGWY